MVRIDTKKILIVIGLGLFILGAIFGYSLGSERVQNNGNGADAVRGDIQSAISQQSSAADRLSVIEAGLDDSAAKAGDLSAGAGVIAESVASAQGRIDESAKGAERSQQLIEEGQRILGQIRSRGPI